MTSKITCLLSSETSEWSQWNSCLFPDLSFKQRCTQCAEGKLSVLTRISERCYHWVDSKSLLPWLHAAKRSRVFDAKRVGELLEMSRIDDWRFVNAKLNPADIGPRGNSVSGLNDSEWITGPAWLKSDSSDFPIQPEDFEPDENETKEASLSADPNTHISSILDWSPYSRFNQLKNIIEKVLLKRLNLSDRHKLAESKILKMILTSAFQSEQAPF